ncbi:hypothetical protein GCM10007425_15830 [Lysinibacillus alkalisoli]|uniref:ABC-2 transporter permease n=1 Tax=Lysinibacillus alkalisoli TaxID=1911548 RepID=A0A917G444_9BACI|nr:ABC-2 transporter permease [Lysinibacillus alkalisoli]GGG22205.1 hypothetical protein GCM10007425_15830 [Lysinibacillus alkalisoli]
MSALLYSDIFYLHQSRRNFIFIVLFILLTAIVFQQGVFTASLMVTVPSFLFIGTIHEQKSTHYMYRLLGSSISRRGYVVEKYSVALALLIMTTISMSPLLWLIQWFFNQSLAMTYTSLLLAITFLLITLSFALPLYLLASSYFSSLIFVTLFITSLGSIGVYSTTNEQWHLSGHQLITLVASYIHRLSLGALLCYTLSLLLVLITFHKCKL